MNLDEMSDLDKNNTIARLLKEQSENATIRIEFEQLLTAFNQQKRDDGALIAQLQGSNSELMTRLGELNDTIRRLSEQISEMSHNDESKRVRKNRSTNKSASENEMDTTSSPSNSHGVFDGFVRNVLRHAVSVGDLAMGGSDDIDDMNIDDGIPPPMNRKHVAEIELHQANKLTPTAHAHHATTSYSFSGGPTHTTTRASGSKVPTFASKVQTLASIAATNTGSKATKTQTQTQTSFAQILANGGSPGTSVSSNQTASSSSLSSGPKSTPKPTPIQLDKLDRATYTSITNGLNSLLNGGDFQWQHSSANGHPRIFAENASTKSSIMKWLNDANISYNTYAERGQKRKAFLIRGLGYGDDDTCLQSINDSFRAAGVAGTITINRFETPHMRRNPNTNANPIYRAIVPHDTIDASIASVKTIGCFRVRIERMKPSNVIQCHNCQRYDHTASNCAFKYRCVQCVGAHLPANCLRNANKSLPIGCINCHSAKLDFTGHTANDHRNCHYFIQRQAASDSRKNTTVTPQNVDRVTPTRNVSPTQPKPLGLSTPIKANNPHASKPTKGGAKRKKAPAQSGKGTASPSTGQSSTSSVLVGLSGGERPSENDKVSCLISALMQVLVRFQQCQ